MKGIAEIMSLQNNKEKGTRITWIWIAVGGVIAIQLLYGFLMLFVFFKNEPQTMGTFGDTFGFINSLFSGLAFVGLIATLVTQRQELKLQRQELAETREEMKLQREEMARQAEAQSRNTEIQRLSSIIQIYASYLDHGGKFDGMMQNWIHANTKREMQEVLNKLKNLDPETPH